MRSGWAILAPVALAVLAGASFVVQAILNARLRVVLQSPVRAGLISYVGGTLTMLVAACVTRDSWTYVRDFRQSAWWLWTGGAFGAAYIIVSIILLPRLGAATVFALIVGGQMLASLLFDQFGAFGLAQRPIDPGRVIGALLLVGGVVLIRR